jgi:3-aminobutyryl-CoA ammonia-lyase
MTSSASEHQIAWLRLRMAPADARYGGGLVDGGRILQLFGDVATELSILQDADEGLFRAYASVDFLAPVRVGDFLEIEGRVLEVGRTSRKLAFEARRRISNDPESGETAGRLLETPEVVVRAVGTVVTPLDRQRRTGAREEVAQ